MTTLRDLTADDIAALSGILAKLRPHGAPRWQPAGVRAALARSAHLDAANVLMAAIRLSQDRSADTPAQIAVTSSECWREKVAEAIWRQTEPASAHCAGCGKTQAECEGRTRYADDHPLHDDHEFRTVERARGDRRAPDAATAIKQAVREEKRELGDRPEVARPARTTPTPGAGRARVEAAVVGGGEEDESA